MPIPPPSPLPDLLVVGAGVIGLAVAREAALRGLRVQVVDGGRPGEGATRAAAGMLSPLAEATEVGPFLEAGLASLALYPEWVDSLREWSPMDPWYRADGKVKVGRGERGAAALAGLQERAREAGVRALPLTPEEARERVGQPLADDTHALFLPDDHQVENRRLHRLLLDATRAQGVEVRGESPVVEVLPGKAGGGHPGVRIRDGGVREAGAVLVAAGAWTGHLLPGVPVTPVLGEMIVLEGGDALPRRVVASPEVYLVPRRDGRLLAGATVEARGFRGRCSPGARQWLLQAATDLLPGLKPGGVRGAGTRVVDHWYGFRPGTPDGNPVLGLLPGAPGIHVASGHFRNGILLAPWTARALGRVLAGGEGPSLPSAFLPGRLASAMAGSGSWKEPSPPPSPPSPPPSILQEHPS